jgi:hypothetical protein
MGLCLCMWNLSSVFVSGPCFSICRMSIVFHDAVCMLCIFAYICFVCSFCLYVFFVSSFEVSAGLSYIF